MVTGWHRAWQRASRRPGFLDLTDSSFHQNGLVPEPELFRGAFERWLATRAYRPESRGLSTAREALARDYTARGWSLDPDQLVLTSGTSEAYSLIFSLFAQAGDSVALPRPGYPLFEHLVRHARLDCVWYDQPAHNAWQPDAASLEAALGPRTRLVVLISPNNPTGQTLGTETLKALAEVCRRRRLIVVVDEVFDAFASPDFPRAAAVAPDLRVLTLNGISKRYGSPDLKLGWIAVSGPPAWRRAAGRRLELLNDAFLSANAYSQALLPDLIAGLEPWQNEVRRLLAANAAAAESWRSVQPRVWGLVPRGGIHGLWRFDGLPPDLDDEAWSLHLLNGFGLALHPGYFYDVQEPGVWLVYSLLKPPHLWAEGLERLGRALSSA